MNVRQLAIQNIRGNWRSYKAFLLSSSFSVAVFYMYTSFVHHPEVAHSNVHIGIRSGLQGCSYLILMFSALFMLSSNATFLDARKKELGLLKLMGSTNARISILLFLEQAVMGLVSTCIGIGIGMLFSNLFLMTLSVLLDLESRIHFIFQIKPLVITVVVYSIMFFSLALFGLWNVRRLEIVDLLLDKRKGRRAFKVGKWRFGLGIILLVCGYTLAVKVTLGELFFYFYPILSTVIIGTYFLFTQGSLFVLKGLQKQKNIYYTYPNLFVFRSLEHKLKDHAKFLFSISILTATVITATGTAYAYFSDLPKSAMFSFPHEISYTEKGIESHEVISPDELLALFEKYGYENVEKVQFIGLPGKFITTHDGRLFPITVISQTDYNKEAKKQGKSMVNNKKGYGTFINPMAFDGQDVYNKEIFYFQMLGVPYQIKLHESKSDMVFNGDGAGHHNQLLVVRDEQFKQWESVIPNHEKYVYYGYNIPNWQEQKKFALEVRGKVSPDYSSSMRNKISIYIQFKEGGAVLLFIGSFISILFFLATCSMTYFKWFSDIEQDRKEYQSLMKIGMEKGEINRIVRRQMGSLFFIPIVVGIVHSIFAFYALSNLMEMNVLFTSIKIIGIYCAATVIYFFFAQKEYMKHID
ncbi:ABC transporter permease [Bacillus cereus]|nr:ABC transporter permease [Bacillus cereus]WJE51877.1 ABC transporter permease [Bacillus cereus]